MHIISYSPLTAQGGILSFLRYRVDFKSGIFVESKSGMLLDVSDPWIGRKHDPRTHCMFWFVQHDRERPVHMPTQPATSPIRAPGRAPQPVDDSLPPWAYDDAAPLRPHKFPPSVIRDRAYLRASLGNRLFPRRPRSHSYFAVHLKVVPVIDERIDPAVHHLQRSVDAHPFILKIPRQPVLPDLMDPLDLPLRGRRVTGDNQHTTLQTGHEPFQFTPVM